MAKKILNHAKINQYADDDARVMLRQYRKRIEKLEAKLEDYQKLEQEKAQVFLALYFSPTRDSPILVPQWDDLARCTPRGDPYTLSLRARAWRPAGHLQLAQRWPRP